MFVVETTKVVYIFYFVNIDQCVLPVGSNYLSTQNSKFSFILKQTILPQSSRTNVFQKDTQHKILYGSNSLPSIFCQEYIYSKGTPHR